MTSAVEGTARPLPGVASELELRRWQAGLSLPDVLELARLDRDRYQRLINCEKRPTDAVAHRLAIIREVLQRLCTADSDLTPRVILRLELAVGRALAYARSRRT